MAREEPAERDVLKGPVHRRTSGDEGIQAFTHQLDPEIATGEEESARALDHERQRESGNNSKRLV